MKFINFKCFLLLDYDFKIECIIWGKYYIYLYSSYYYNIIQCLSYIICNNNGFINTLIAIKFLITRRIFSYQLYVLKQRFDNMLFIEQLHYFNFKI
jgi:hypothetical protein